MSFVKYVDPKKISKDAMLWVAHGEIPPDRIKSPVPVLSGRLVFRVGAFVHKVDGEGVLGDTKDPIINQPKFEFRSEYPDLFRADLVTPATTTATATGPPVSSAPYVDIFDLNSKTNEYYTDYPNDSSKDREEFLAKQTSTSIQREFKAMFDQREVGEFIRNDVDVESKSSSSDIMRQQLINSLRKRRTEVIEHSCNRFINFSRQPYPGCCYMDDANRYHSASSEEKKYNAYPSAMPLPEILNDRVHTIPYQSPPKPRHGPFIPLKFLLTPPRVWSLEEMTWSNESFWKCYIITIITDGVQRISKSERCVDKYSQTIVIPHYDILGFCLRQLYYLVGQRLFPHKTNQWCLQVFSSDAARRLSYGIYRFIDSLAYMRIHNTRELELDCLMVLFRGFLNRSVSHM